MKLNISLLDSKFMIELLLKYSGDPKIELEDISYISTKNIVEVSSHTDGTIAIHKDGFIQVSAAWNGYPEIRIEVYLEIFKRLNLFKED